jgi:L-lactate dehydrogenase complex protein LldF
LPDWEELRETGRQFKVHTMAHLPDYLAQFEAAVTARGGIVHWGDANEANVIVMDLVRGKGADEVVKVKSMATQRSGSTRHWSRSASRPWKLILRS